MLGINNYIPIRVITERGVVQIDKINPGDRVYEYPTGHLIPVMDVVKNKSAELLNVMYTDRRVQVYADSSMIYTGGRIMNIKDAKKRIPFKPIETPALDYQTLKFRPEPDPYIAGPLLTYGNLKDENINLPLEIAEYKNELLYKYGLMQMNISKIKSYYSYPDKPDTPVTWTEFFPYCDVMPLNDIPDTYMYTTIENRKQFIRGVFDAGFKNSKHGDQAFILSKNKSKLLNVQRMLWSLGIPSIVSYHYPSPQNNVSYELVVQGPKECYPGFFYDRKYIETMISADNAPVARKTPNSIQISGINWVQHGFRWTRGFMSNLVLPKKNMMYFDEFYLPRVSL